MIQTKNSVIENFANDTSADVVITEGADDSTEVFNATNSDDTIDEQTSLTNFDPHNLDDFVGRIINDLNVGKYQVEDSIVSNYVQEAKTLSDSLTGHIINNDLIALNIDTQYYDDESGIVISYYPDHEIDVYFITNHKSLFLPTIDARYVFELSSDDQQLSAHNASNQQNYSDMISYMNSLHGDDVPINIYDIARETRSEDSTSIIHATSSGVDVWDY